jgi:hypothetical protein
MNNPDGQGRKRKEATKMRRKLKRVKEDED